MSFTDETLYCRDCNQEFTFTVGEQEFYASRGLMNKPSRCSSCRAARKQSGGQGGGNYGGGGGGGRGGYREREPRQMYSVTCASCGNEAQVPFQPRDDRPVYCSDCFQAQGSGQSNHSSRW
jgi:CxxC-x17-CxxC domain-containing protein